jgi:hypothetical protein
MQLTPHTLNFGTQKVGTTSQPQVITVTNIGSIAVRFKDISFGSGDWRDFSQTNNCIPQALKPGDSCAVTVTFDPGKIGPRTTVLNFEQQSQPTANPAPPILRGTGD